LRFPPEADPPWAGKSSHPDHGSSDPSLVTTKQAWLFLVSGLCPFPRKSVLPDAVATQLPGCAPDLLGNIFQCLMLSQKPLRDFLGAL